MRDTFNIIVSISISMLLSCILIIIWFENAHNSVIQRVRLEGTQQEAEFYGQKLVFQFSQPLQKNTGFITVVPNTPFSTTIGNNTLSIEFTQPLAPNTSYTVMIDKNYMPNVVQNQLQYTFTTRNEQLVYIADGEKNDAIVQVDADLKNMKLLLEEEHLYSFAINKNYIVVPFSKMNNNLTPLQYLKIINLNSKLKDEIEIPNTKIINSALSPTQDIAALVYEEKREDKKANKVTYTRGMMLYDLTDKSFKKIDSQNTIIEQSDLQYSPDGMSILYNGAQSTFYLMDLSDIKNINIVGKYRQTGGFSVDGSKLIFTEDAPQTDVKQPRATSISIKESNKEDITYGPFSESITDPIFAKTSTDFFYSVENERLDNHTFLRNDQAYPRYAMHKVVKSNIQGEREEIIKKAGVSFEVPQASATDRYILMEKYEKNSFNEIVAQRILPYGTKPSEAEIVVYDLQNKKLLENNIKGINAKWR